MGSSRCTITKLYNVASGIAYNATYSYQNSFPYLQQIKGLLFTITNNIFRFLASHMNWVNSNFYYLLLMLLSISYPFIRSFEYRLAFYKNWKALFTAIGCMMIVFISWDIIFTYLVYGHSMTDTY